jgi:hypothetical protein
LSAPRPPYYAEPRKPNPIRNKRAKRKTAGSLPAQTIEIIHPNYASPVQNALDMRFEFAPENRLIQVTL